MKKQKHWNKQKVQNKILKIIPREKQKQKKEKEKKRQTKRKIIPNITEQNKQTKFSSQTGLLKIQL